MKRQVPPSYYSSSRARRSGTTTALVFAAVSVAFHGLVLAVAEVSGVGRVRVPLGTAQPATPASTTAESAKPLPTPSCDADVVLAAAARMLYCTSPLDRGESCVRKALTSMSLGFTTCDAVALATDVILMTPEQVAQIEPEPLIELLDPLEQKKFEEAQEKALEQSFQAAQKQMEQIVARDAQVVEVTRPSVEAPPEHARFLSEHDSRVDKQTVARGSTEQMTERPRQHDLMPKDDPREASASKTPEDSRPATDNPDAPEAPSKLAMREPGKFEPPRLAQEALTAGVTGGSDEPLSERGIRAARGNSMNTETAREAADGRHGEDGGGGGRPMVPNLRATEDVLERAVGGGSVDHLDDVERGEVTALNSKRWKYATFFNRMKRHVAQNWHPDRVYLRRDPSGNVYGSRNRITYLQVSLNPEGAITKIHIVKSSGVDFLDEEAVRAFHAAQPFPNPPQGLVDQSSRMITFEFGFHYEIGRRGGWKVFRHR
jgi:TonB family protein